MKKVNLKLGSVKSMLTKEEMKEISGGYPMCCCVGGTYGNLDPCTHSWSTSPSPDCSTACGTAGASGGYWDGNSPCNHWGQC